MPTGSRPTVFRWAACAGLLAVVTVFAADPREPRQLPPIVLDTKVPAPGAYDIPIVDPGVQPAQRLGEPIPASVPDSAAPVPAFGRVATGVSTSPGRTAPPVTDPPPPVVQLQIRTPSYVPTGKPVPYKITVTNTSQAKALRVKVRMPAPTGAAGLTKCEPRADNVKELPAGSGELVWTLASLNRGESKSFELEFTPQANVKQIAATAYVSFEYGAKVETGIDKPTVKVNKVAPPQVAVNEPITVRVSVTNDGPVPVPNAVLTESAPPEVDIRGDADAEKTNNPGQRAWKLGTIAPGQTKTVTYQLVSRNSGTVATASDVRCDAGALSADSARSETKVLQPALQLAFAGPPKGEAKAPVTYTATVKNAGTMPLENVRLTVDVPEDLTVVKLTNGCRTDRGKRVWVIPKLPAGDAQEFRLQVTAELGTSGRRTLTATARDGGGRLQEQAKEATTDFVGRADLSWKPTFDKVVVPVGRQGNIRVLVRNQGSETEKGVRLRVILPPEVKLTDTNPGQPNLSDNTLVFPPQAVPPGKTVEFTVTYQGKSPGSAQFRLLLEAESLEKAVTKDQVVEIER